MKGHTPCAADPCAENTLKIRFWKDIAEFEARAANHKPIGWETVPEEKPARQPHQTPAARIHQGVRSFYENQQAEIKVANKGNLLKLQNAAAVGQPYANRHRVYILKSAMAMTHFLLPSDKALTLLSSSIFRLESFSE